MISLVDIIRANCPTASFDPIAGLDVVVEDHGDGPRIAFWNVQKLGAQPGDEQLAAWRAAYVVPVERRMVAKSAIVERLHNYPGGEKLTAAQAALNANAYNRERWYAPDKPGVYADDPEVLALLTAIGVDPEIILAA